MPEQPEMEECRHAKVEEHFYNECPVRAVHIAYIEVELEHGHIGQVLNKQLPVDEALGGEAVKAQLQQECKGDAEPIGRVQPADPVNDKICAAPGCGEAHKDDKPADNKEQVDAGDACHEPVDRIVEEHNHDGGDAAQRIQFFIPVLLVVCHKGGWTNGHQDTDVWQISYFPCVYLRRTCE